MKQLSWFFPFFYCLFSIFLSRTHVRNLYLSKLFRSLGLYAKFAQRSGWLLHVSYKGDKFWFCEIVILHKHLTTSLNQITVYMNYTQYKEITRQKHVSALNLLFVWNSAIFICLRRCMSHIFRCGKLGTQSFYYIPIKDFYFIIRL